MALSTFDATQHTAVAKEHNGKHFYCEVDLDMRYAKEREGLHTKLFAKAAASKQWLFMCATKSRV